MKICHNNNDPFNRSKEFSAVSCAVELEETPVIIFGIHDGIQSIANCMSLLKVYTYFAFSGAGGGEEAMHMQYICPLWVTCDIIVCECHHVCRKPLVLQITFLRNNPSRWGVYSSGSQTF